MANKRIKYISSLLPVFLLFPAIASADSFVSIIGSPYKVIEEKPEATNTGLHNIFIVRDIKDTKIVYKSSKSTNNIEIFKFGSAGAAPALTPETDVTIDNGTLTLNNPSGDCGYYVTENANPAYYFWVVNYADHVFSISKISASPDQQCEATVLDIEASASPIYYYTINGARQELNRDIRVEYTTQEYSTDAAQFLNVDKEISQKSLSSILYVTPPAYCSTYFTISGDRYLRTWSEEVSMESSVIQPVAVACKTGYVGEEENEESEEDSNVIRGDGTLSAPAEFNFFAATTEGAVFYEWQVARDPEFQDLITTSTFKDFDYTFNEEGMYYVQFVAASENDFCMTSEQYNFQVGASDLVCPNAFSPNGDGVNDVWKVSYRSLIDFHCEIFNRNGQLLYSFSDPSDGWDGTYHGRKVKSGVYYYVIVATGADGRKYKNSGDINIINSVYYGGSGETEPSESPE